MPSSRLGYGQLARLDFPAWRCAPSSIRLALPRWQSDRHLPLDVRLEDLHQHERR
jgi:hypothetical protein